METAVYESRKAEWLKSHREEFVLIRGEDVVGFFPSFRDAYLAGVERYGTDVDFLVKQVIFQDPIFEMF